MNKQKHIISMIILIIVVAGGSFYGGMKYDASKNSSQVAASRGAGQGGFTGGAGRVGAGQGAGAQRGPGANGGGFAGGQITAKDDTSITIAARNGGSQIIFYSPSTTIGKSVSGAISDLSVGEQVTVTGKANSDGSIAAQDIQIRPASSNQGQPQASQSNQ
jgi:hypothetical protein